MNADGYRRCDGARFSTAELAGCVLIHPSELEELVWGIDLVEDWLLHTSDETLADLACFLNHSCYRPAPEVADITTHLGRASVMLHRLIRASRSTG